MKAVKHQLTDICDALKDLTENTTDCQLVSECHSTEKEINYRRIYCFTFHMVWHSYIDKCYK